MLTATTLVIIFAILIIHWVADFMLQTNEQAKGKSSDMGCLLAHTSSYTLLWFFCITPYSLIIGVSAVLPIIFCAITFFMHTITDYYTSRLNKYLWEKKDVHNFFVSVGGDQILHYMQLFLTFYLLYT